MNFHLVISHDGLFSGIAIRSVNEKLKAFDGCPSNMYAETFLRRIASTIGYQWDSETVQEQADTEMMKDIGRMCGLLPEGGKIVNYEGHQGTTRTKSFLRSKVYVPGLKCH